MSSGSDNPSSADNFDGESLLPPAPVPPHERPWRHPAEVAAAQTFDLGTYPTGATTRSKLIAFGTVVASMVVTIVFAQVLRPVERGRDSPEAVVREAASTTSVAMSSAPTAQGVYRITGSSYSAIAVTTDNGRRLYISPRDAATERIIKLQDSTLLVLATVDNANNLAVWTAPIDAEVSEPTNEVTFSPRDPVTVWDGDAYIGSIGLATTKSSVADGLIPLDISPKVHAGSPVYGDAGELLGLVIVRNHARWLLPIEAVCTHVHELNGIGAIINSLGFAPLHRENGVEVGFILGASQFKSGDLITSVGTKAVDSVVDLIDTITTSGVGTQTFRVVRGNESLELEVVLSDR